MILDAIRINDEFFVLIADRPRGFFKPSLMIVASKKTYIKDKAESIAVLPPKLYLVVFYQVSLVNRTGLTCSDFKRPVGVLLGSACYTISHVHTPWGNCNKFYSMIVSVKDLVS